MLVQPQHSDFRALVEHNPKAVMMASDEPRILYVNKAFERITGYAEDEVLGHKPSILSSGLHGKSFYQAMWQELRTRQHWEGMIWNRRRNGELYPQWLTIYPLESTDEPMYAGVFTDVGDAQHIREKVTSLAYYDVLTQLPNRYLFQEFLNTRVWQEETHGRPFSLLFIDLDFFKEINDLHGHAVGDDLLQRASQRLRAALRDDDLIARLSGDEFAAIVELTDPEAVQRLCLWIIDTLKEPFRIEGHDLWVSASIGSASFPDHARTSRDLLQHADQAMYAAKSAGRSCYRVYEPAWSHEIQTRQRRVETLQQALQHGFVGFHVEYQPLYMLGTGEVAGLEALLRWHHPELGAIPPTEFISLAESRGWIDQVSEGLIDTILADLSTTTVAPAMGIRLAVNLSALEFTDDRLRSRLMRLKERLDPMGWELEIEITESQLMNLSPIVLEYLSALRAQGIRIAIDDFGTGYSSLAYLHRLPVDTLKIDRSFVFDMHEDRNGTIVTAILAMAHALGLEVVGEGIEHSEQRRRLAEQGCDYGQGFGLARPDRWSDRLFRPIDATQYPDSKFRSH
ncbi:putative bifunctional diguanylate cyclase/phosphodiesterase [Saccharospirillum salsuginis]|uniref:PAS domain S-box-containing protein/diguanylate cyclase (GGDEF) domain-containing protein n=1 Tax=Saccharospirillum salsuginis TaxID=418750 RepID=A0A918KL02_9GAMM|nr:EAL domain-containing protein [Saccharospirillum salsuginis]GGX67454.1 hypothetical protein GCM10007392_38830 [Saccharospirillum salsuginis]